VDLLSSAEAKSSIKGGIVPTSIEHALFENAPSSKHTNLVHNIMLLFLRSEHQPPHQESCQELHGVRHRGTTYNDVAVTVRLDVE